MTNAQIAENFVAEMISRIKRRMDSFGDSYEKAKSMIQLESCAGDRAWALVDAHFAK